MSVIYENNNIRIETQDSEIPWLKIYAQAKAKEMSDLSFDTKMDIYGALEAIESEMLEYYKPTKINIASFGNHEPQVHWHIMARFENDSHYPESMWGKKQRDSNLDLPSLDIFCKTIHDIL